MFTVILLVDSCLHGPEDVFVYINILHASAVSTAPVYNLLSTLVHPSKNIYTSRRFLPTWTLRNFVYTLQLSSTGLLKVATCAWQPFTPQTGTADTLTSSRGTCSLSNVYSIAQKIVLHINDRFPFFVFSPFSWEILSSRLSSYGTLSLSVVYIFSRR